jgi:hypothetical protein
MLLATVALVLKFQSTYLAKSVAGLPIQSCTFAAVNNHVGILRRIIEFILATDRQAHYHWQHSFAGRPVNRAPGRCRRGGRDGTQDEAQCACCHHLLCIPDGSCVRDVLARGRRPTARWSNGAVGIRARLRRRGRGPAPFSFLIVPGDSPAGSRPRGTDCNEQPAARYSSKRLNRARAGSVRCSGRSRCWRSPSARPGP